MNKKAFTLIELLAVIVILAIIALIATPIVLSIIKDSRESANLRSAETYLKAVEQAVSIEKMNNSSFNPYRCEIINGSLICDKEENKIIKVEVNGKVPDRGVVYFINGKIEGISIKYNNKTISTNKEGNLEYGNMEKICFPVTAKNKTTGNVPNGEYNKGDEYICEVALGTYHRFFVLSKDQNKISLIIDRNITKEGSEITQNNKGGTDWISKNDYENVNGNNWDANVDRNNFGPVTAMNYLYSATQSWNNIPNIEMNYINSGYISNYGYKSIITENNITKIIKNDGRVVTKKDGTELMYENLKARLPYYSELSNFNETNLWMYNHLKNYSNVYGEGLENNDNCLGYWSISSSGNGVAPFIYWHGTFTASAVNNGAYGIRPVIELSKNNIVGGES